MVGFIYKYDNKVNHKVYVGQTVDLVARQHSHKSKSLHVKNKFYNAVRKYGWENFDFSVLAQVEAETLDELSSILDKTEEYYIERYDSFNNGYNSTTGGHSCRGKIMPESFYDYCKNRVYSPETRKKMSDSRKGIKLPSETKKKLSIIAKQRGFARYREIYNEKRLTNLKKAKSKAVMQIDAHGTIVNTFASEREAAKYILNNLAKGIRYSSILNSIAMHCNNKYKKKYYYGFEWKLTTNV